MPDDMVIPYRDLHQINMDQQRTHDQVAQLHREGQSARQSTGQRGERGSKLDEILLNRHNSGRGGQRFELVDTRDRTRQTLVVAGQLVVSEKSLGTTGLGDSIDQELFEDGFVRRDLTSDNLDSEALAGLVRVYDYSRNSIVKSENAVRATVESLTSNGVEASPTMVTALHIVVKSMDGPAPTVVTVPDSDGQVGEIVVAVIDDGIVHDERADGWLNEVDRDPEDERVDPLDWPRNGYLDFAAGHGTFVAGIVRQVDPPAQIKVYRALDSDGLGTELDVATALLKAADEGAKIINLSLGMTAYDDAFPCVALSAVVKSILDKRDGPVIVASAGNYGDDKRVYPAALRGVVSVGALQAVNDPQATDSPGAKWSTHGDWVRCSTVGEGIVSTFVEGDEDPQFQPRDAIPDTYPSENPWAVWSGTSFAAPQISGLIAERCRKDGLSPREVVESRFPEVRSADGYGKHEVRLPGTKPTP